jgi:hypothetical protein
MPMRACHNALAAPAAVRPVFDLSSQMFMHKNLYLDNAIGRNCRMFNDEGCDRIELNLDGPIMMSSKGIL